MLLLKVRRSILSHSPTMLTHACRFLWAEYKDEYWWFEVVQQLRKLLLTGYVMMMPQHTPNARLLMGIVVTLTFLTAMIYVDPFRSSTDSRLFALQQIRLSIRNRGAKSLAVDYKVQGLGRVRI